MPLHIKAQPEGREILKVNSPGEQVLVSDRWAQFRHDKWCSPLPGVLLREKGSKFNLPFSRSLAFNSLKEGTLLSIGHLIFPCLSPVLQPHSQKTYSLPWHPAIPRATGDLHLLSALLGPRGITRVDTRCTGRYNII